MDKKGPGPDQATLKNREKAVIIYTSKSKYLLFALLKRIGLSKSGYYYQETVKNNPINTAIFAVEYINFSTKINSGMDSGAFMVF